MAILTTDTTGSGTLHVISTANDFTILRPDVFFVSTGSSPTFSITGSQTSLMVAGAIYNVGTGNAVSIATASTTSMVVQPGGSIVAESNNAIRGTGGGALVLTNNGFLQSGSANVINGSGTLSTGMRLILTNTGTINAVSGLSALVLGDGRDVIVNTGTIIGDVVLGNGNNALDTHLGRISGFISGGTGSDAYTIAGSELIYDSGGTDMVYSHGDYTLQAALENLELRGQARFGAGNAAQNFITGNITDSRLNGRGGAGFLVGQGGDDVIFGGQGNDYVIVGDGENQAYGGEGDDIIVVGVDADVLDGGTGVDTIEAVSSTAAVFIDLGTGTVSGGFIQGDAIRGFENVYGSNLGDTITGSGVSNVLSGRNGDDMLSGAGGDDRLEGGAGADALDGGGGNDTIDFSNSGGAETVDLTLGIGTGNNAQGDTYVSIENVLGSVVGDTVIGSGLSNVLDGYFGDDILSGRGGNDVLEGGDGDDSLTGGAGADVFLFADTFSGPPGGWGNDTIADFQDGQDRISFVGDTGVTSFASLSFSSVGDGTLITTGAGDTILLSGIALAALDASDFIFG